MDGSMPCGTVCVSDEGTSRGEQRSSNVRGSPYVMRQCFQTTECAPGMVRTHHLAVAVIVVTEPLDCIALVQQVCNYVRKPPSVLHGGHSWCQ